MVIHIMIYIYIYTHIYTYIYMAYGDLISDGPEEMVRLVFLCLKWESA